MNINFLSRNRRSILLAVFLFVLLDPCNSAEAQSNRRANPTTSSSSSGSKYQAITAAQTEVRAAFLRTMADEKVQFDDHKIVFDWLTETTGKEKWRKIRWRHDLWDARIESAKTGKPIFIWAMNGDPLGCV